MKLFRVTTKGLMYSASKNMHYEISYVLATDPTEAYDKVKINLEKLDVGFACDRILDKIELIADTDGYSLTMLYM